VTREGGPGSGAGPAPGPRCAAPGGDRLPLAGVVVLVTRAADQAAALAEPLAALGARVVLTPAIRFEEPSDWGPADAALRSAAAYAWAIFTSANGVEAVDRRLRTLGLSWEGFRAARIVAIGPATAGALTGRGLAVAVVPDPYQAEGVVAALGGEPLEGRRILLARAERAREILPEALRARGARVDVAAVYRTAGCPPAPEAVEVLARPEAAGRVVAAFTSSSTVEHFLDGLPEEARRGLARAVVAAIGPITAQTLAARGLPPAIQPADFTIPALVEAIRCRFERPPSGAQPTTPPSV
jgi:uroporphyrinogen III methyltransferase/synthase